MHSHPANGYLLRHTLSRIVVRLNSLPALQVSYCNPSIVPPIDSYFSKRNTTHPNSPNPKNRLLETYYSERETEGGGKGGGGGTILDPQLLFFPPPLLSSIHRVRNIHHFFCKTQQRQEHLSAVCFCQLLCINSTTTSSLLPLLHP